jgi:hypothetical protein
MPIPQFTTRPDPRNLADFPEDAAQMMRELPIMVDEFNAALATLQAQFLNGTSTSSNSIGSGSKTFLSQGGKAWPVGQWLVATSLASPANFMVGQVTSYNTGTGLLVLNVQQTAGSGTFASWGISIAVAPATGLDAGNLTTGIVPDGRLQGNYTQITSVSMSGTVRAASALVESATPDVVLHETDQAGTAGRWRVAVDGDNLRIQRSANGEDFITPATSLQISPAGVITGNGSGLTGVTAAALSPAAGFAAQALVLFNGKLSSGDLRLRSANVSSITDQAVGQYLVNLTSPLSTVNGLVIVTVGDTLGRHVAGSGYMLNASQAQIYTFGNEASSSFSDFDRVSVIIL